MAETDNRKIFAAYYIGEDIESKKAKYTDPHIIYANVSEPVSYETIEDIGRIPEYDRTIIIGSGSKSEFLREDSLLWVDTIPNDIASNFDYTIARVGDVINGKVKLYCNAIAPNTQFLYHSNDSETIYQTKVFYKDHVAIIPKNMYFPINADTLVWYMKPSNASSTRALLRLVSKIENEKTYSYVFEDVE